MEERDLFHQDIHDLQLQLQNLAMHNEQLTRQNHELSQEIQNMASEKEEIIIAHTRETENLWRDLSSSSPACRLLRV
jgi:cell division protein FtsB